MITLPTSVARFVARQREQADKQREALGIEARSWYRISNAASPDEAEVMLYDEVGGWYGATADQFIADLVEPACAHQLAGRVGVRGHRHRQRAALPPGEHHDPGRRHRRLDRLRHRDGR
jgi:hypothetical protein